ncbi:centromere-associated protein E-like [Anopheles nili]|uniref:centromere-associated protein E-like n=1 Tax=Anopheles nili TaxID=185578 RepID=UPI00237BC948|nr:centromere-associated protein E-like [Anopheles nili]
MSDNVKVSIKVRPLIRREKENKLTLQWRIRDNTIVSNDGNGDPFVFDHIFDETVSTKQLFDTVCRPVILSALNGINGTIFAYGQTSSGKTYTMIGNENEPGVVPLTAREIFEQIKRIKEREFLIRAGFIEIYNEKIHDLLTTGSTNLKIVENQCGDVSVNLKEILTNCPEQIIQLVDAGNKARKIGETNMNERSSRSHTIFRIIIESRLISASNDDTGKDNEAVQIGILNLVDLAGSERADQTGATGSRFKEGVCINKSLLSLSCVIQKLSENSDKQFINYRDSKLTRILQASLGGNAVTSMICNITPAVVDETYYTLSFAMRAKNIRNKPKVNEILTDAAMMKRLEREIKRLKSVLRTEQSKIKTMELINAITLRTNQFISSNQPQAIDHARRRTWCPSNTEIPRPLMGPPASASAAPYLVTTNDMTPQIATRAIPAEDDYPSPSVGNGGFRATLALMGDDVSQSHHRDLLLDHQEMLKRPRRSPSPNLLLNPFSVDGEEFVPGEQISFGPSSLSPTSSMTRDLHTPRVLRKTRRSSTGDSPSYLDYEQRCRVLEQELQELQEFTKLESSIELETLKQELVKREETLAEQKYELDEKQHRMEQLEERCAHLESELENQKTTVCNAEQELARAIKERHAADRQAELHRNQLTGIEFEFERFRQRSESREKELIETLQEARSAAGATPNSSDSLKVDQKREEMKRLEMQNYEFTLQLEKCNKQMEQLKESSLEEHRKIEQVKQIVLQYQLLSPCKESDATQSLVLPLRKLLLLAENETTCIIKQNGFHPVSPPAAENDADCTNGHDGNTTVLGEEKTIQELLNIIEELEKKVSIVEHEKCTEQEANKVRLSELKLVLEKKSADAVEQLEQQLKQWRQKFETQTNEYDELSTQMMDQMQENDVLRKDFEACSQKLVEMENATDTELAAVRKTLEQSDSKREELQRLCNSLSGEIINLKAEIEKQTTSVSELEALKMQTTLEYGELRCEKEELSAQLKRLEQEIESYKHEMQSINDEHEKLIKQLNGEKDALESANNEFRSKVDTLQNALQHLQEQSNLLDEAKLHSSEKQTLEKDLQDMRDSQAEQATRLAELHQELQKLLEEIESLKNTIDQLTEEKNGLTEQLARRNTELLEVQELNKTIDKRVLELESEIERYQCELQTSRAEQTALVSKHEEQREAYESCQNMLEKEIESTKCTILRLTEENENVLKRRNGDDEEQKLLLDELTRCKDTLVQQLKQTEEELAKITSALDVARSESISLMEQRKSDREELDLVKQKQEEQVQLMTDRLNEEKTRTEQQNDARRKLEERNATIEQELASLQQNVLQLMNENEALLKDQLEEERSERQRVSAEGEELEKLRSCRDESERLLGQLECDLATARKELEMVRSELLEEKRRRDEIEHMEKKSAQTMLEETERLKCAIMALEDEKHRLQEADGRLRDQLKVTENRTVELEANVRDKESLLEELRKENNDLTVAVQELSAKIVSLEEQMDGNEASQRKTIDALVEEKQTQEATAAALMSQVQQCKEKLCAIEHQYESTQQELRSMKAALEASLAVRMRLELDAEESSSVRDVLERELQDLKSDLENLDGKLANERYEQERHVSAGLRRELDEKRKELESFMATGRPSLGDGRVVQALRRENEDLLKQLEESRQTDIPKGKQLQERISELEAENEQLREEMSTMRHEASFNEKEKEITHLRQKVQTAEKVREETVTQKRTIERAYDQLRFKNQKLAKEVDELRRTTDKERKSRRQSTHDDRRGLFNTKEMGTMTDPSSSECACSEMDAQIRDLRNKLTLKDCQLNTQKLITSANPLKNEITEMRRKLEEQYRDKAQLEREMRELLEQLDRERKERKRHCTQCIRHSRQQNARCDKAVQAYQPTTAAGVSDGVGADVDPAELQRSLEKQQEQYEQLMVKYQSMKQLCRLRNEKITSLCTNITDMENEKTNMNCNLENECTKLKQQLKEAEIQCALLNRASKVGGKSINKSEVGSQTDFDVCMATVSNQEAQMYRDKYERYKALAAKLLEETKTAKLNTHRTVSGV